MVSGKPLPFPEPVLAEADKKRLDGIRKSIERCDLIAGMPVKAQPAFADTQYRIKKDKTNGFAL